MEVIVGRVNRDKVQGCFVGDTSDRTPAGTALGKLHRRLRPSAPTLSISWELRRSTTAGNCQAIKLQRTTLLHRADDF